MQPQSQKLGLFYWVLHHSGTNLKPINPQDQSNQIELVGIPNYGSLKHIA